MADSETKENYNQFIIIDIVKRTRIAVVGSAASFTQSLFQRSSGFIAWEVLTGGFGFEMKRFVYNSKIALNCIALFRWTLFNLHLVAFYPLIFYLSKCFFIKVIDLCLEFI